MTTQQTIQQDWQTVKTGDGPMSVYVSTPSGKGPYPGLIVFQEAFGVTSHVRGLCDRFAAAGFVAAAPELFHRAGDHTTAAYDDSKKYMSLLGALTNSQLLDDTSSTFDLLREHSKVDKSRIAATGYCMGGFASVLAGCNFSLKAVVSYYGGGMLHVRPNIGFTPILDDFKNLRCPVLLVYGGLDAGISQQDRDTIESRLKALHKKYDLWVYPEAGHGFFTEDRSSYHKPSAEDVWPKTLDWLNKTLA
jgi:carboxymethylenebutenolidase